MNYSPHELSLLLKQSRENIRLWSVEFAPHLSKSANPEGRGKHRSYSEDDISVLALVADCKNRGLTFDEIHKSLNEGERLSPQLATVNGTNQLALQKRITDLETELADLRGKYHEVVGREKLLRELLNEANELLRKGQG